MRYIGLALVFVVTALLFVGCGSSRDLLATIGKEDLTLSDFETRYAKYNGGWDKASRDSTDKYQDFLNLLVKFRLKVLEAERQGLPEEPDAKAELEAYRLTIGASYVTEKELIEPSVQELYRRKSEMIRARHILVGLNPGFTPEDTLKAYHRALEILSQVTPANFDSLAYEFSTDPSAKVNRGDLGFFSQGRMVKEFEDAAYSLRPGEISKAPVRTSFGYHILHVTHRQRNPGALTIAHLLKRFKDDRSDTAAVTEAVFAVYDSLQKGLSFEEAVARHTDDPYTRDTGGDIGSYERERVPPTIADVLFETPVGSITPPIRMDYGYHIIKVKQQRDVPSFEEMKRELTTLFRERFYPSVYENFVHNLKKQQRLSFDIGTYETLQRSFDTTKTVGSKGWADTLTGALLSSRLFSWNGKDFLVRDFVRLGSAMEEFHTLLLSPATIQRMVERITELLVLNELIARSPEHYRDLEEIMREYRDGILLYRIEQEEVWKKIAVTDSALRDFHALHRDEYRWPPRVSFAEIQVRTDSLAKALYQRVLEGEDFGLLAEQHTIRPGFAEKKGVWGFTPETQNQLTRAAAGMAVDSIAAPVLFEGKWSIIKKLASDTARVKTYEEAIPEVTSGYQEYAAKQREREWVEQLRRRFGVREYPELLSRAFRKGTDVDKP